MNTSEEYKFQNHDKRISDLEEDINTMFVSQARIEAKLLEITKKLENGISTKLETLSTNMSILMPYVENQKEWDKTIRISVLGIVFSAGGALLLFVVRLFFVNGS